MINAVIFQKDKCPECPDGTLELYSINGVPMWYLDCLKRGSLNGTPSFFKCTDCGLFFDLDWTESRIIPKPLTYTNKLKRFLEANYGVR